MQKEARNPKETPHLISISLTNSEGGFVDLRFLTADQREALYNEVWSEPMTTVSKRYGMSDKDYGNIVRRLEFRCRRLAIGQELKLDKKYPGQIYQK
jgi:hypothetical protein